MDITFSNKWDLVSLFPGESQSPQLLAALHTLDQDLAQLKIDLDQGLDLPLLIERMQATEALYQELEAFISCLTAQNVFDQYAIQLNAQIANLKARCEIVSDQLNARLTDLLNSDFKKLLHDFPSLAFTLEERRSWAKEKLPLPQEHLINQLTVDGYHGWSQLYNTLMGQIQIPFQSKEEIEYLSVGQAENRLSYPERQVRQAMFQQWESTWKKQEETFAQILNHLGGFRLRTYQQRDWDSILKEPLFYNRMQASTLETMWQVIEHNKDSLVTYLNQKAAFLELPQLSWYDVEAPFPLKDRSSLPFEEAADIIIMQFNRFSPQMGAFARQAFEKRWIEAEDRPGKLPGGFCSQHPQSEQSRIFMTYSGTLNNLFTLAHELGHAYHNHTVRKLPIWSQQYRMNVAETASTLAEMIVIDAILQDTSNPEQRRALLDSKLQRSAIFLMNIHARFIFEKEFYAERNKGFVMAQTLNQLMESAQREAFANSLAEWHPHFWVAKRHFYITEVPFYNFPYTFGYLFSLGIYAQYLQMGPEFAKHYDDLLRDTGRMPVEELAIRHLGADLTQPHFWQAALDLIKQDIIKYCYQ